MGFSTSSIPQESQLITRLWHIALYLIPCLTLGLTGLFLFASAGRDDMHITYWAANTFAKSGQILNYNGDRIEQSSSLLHVVILAGLARLTGLDIVSLGKSSSVLFGLVNIIVLFRLVTRVADRAAGFSAAMLTATAVFFVYWSYGGLESTLVALTGTALIMIIDSHIRHQTGSSLFWSTLVMFLFELVRPEAPLILGCVLTGTIVVIGLKELLARERNLKHRAFLHRTLGLFGIWLATSGLVLLFRWSEFGSVFPQPVIAKSAGFSRASLASGIYYLKSTLWSSDYGLRFFAIVLVISTCVLLFKQLRAMDLEPYLLLSLLYVGVNFAFIIFAGGDWMEGGRFFVHFLPIAVAFIPLALASVTKYKWPLAFTTLLLIGVQVASLIRFAQNSSTGVPIWSEATIDPAFDTSTYSWFERHNRLNLRDLPTIEYLNEVVTVLIDHRHRPVIIMSGQMGMIPYHVSLMHYGEVYFVDRLGLTDRTFTDCPVTESLPRSTTGLELDYEIYFRKLTDLKYTCQIDAPDIIFDLGSVMDSQVELHGYTAIYVQTGEVQNDDSRFQGARVRADQFIAVRNDLLPLLDEVRPVSIRFGD